MSEPIHIPAFNRRGVLAIYRFELARFGRERIAVIMPDCEGKDLLVAAERRGRHIADNDWIRAGHAALKAGRWREAYRCFHRAEDEDGLTAEEFYFRIPITIAPT